MTDRHLMACAFHEAGHCVTAMLVGYKVKCVELLKTDGDGLQARTRYASTRQRTSWCDLAVTLAGPIAESRYSNRDVVDVLKEGEPYEKSDLNRALREAERLAALKLYTSVDHALLVGLQRAREMLDGFWPIVEKTARALYRTGRID